MTKNDLTFIKKELKKSTFCNDFLTIIEISGNIETGHCPKIKVVYNDKVVTIGEFGFAYLISWWCDGSITSAFANEITSICRHYNGRF